MNVNIFLSLSVLFYGFCCSDAITGVQRRSVTCPRSHSWPIGEIAEDWKEVQIRQRPRRGSYCIL